MKVIHVAYPLELPLVDYDVSSIIIAIGDFDGVHLGHQDVIGQAVRIGQQRGLPVAVMTFHPHPREVLGKLTYSRYLSPLPEKLALIEDLGVDYTFVVQFDDAFSKVSPIDFVQNVLMKLDVHTVVVGFDFTFGNQAEGTVETLKELSDDQMDVTVVKPYQLQGEKISSTLIRELLHLGRLPHYSLYTGRHYRITGRVIHGDGRGQTIGFPTANIELSERYVIPANGVYAVRFVCGCETFNGVMNIGVRPTFQTEDDHPRLEVHVLDFDGDLYGQQVTVEFIEFLRPEQKFTNVQSLVKQITEDVKHAREIFNK